MKKYLVIIGFCAIMTSLFSQANESIDIVKVKVVCSGNSEAAAVTEGLRSALTQTSGVFISENTTVINDQITNDQMTMINNGSIAEYKIIERFQSDQRYTLTLEVGVSVNKLGSFVKNSGGQTELQGGLFAANIKLNELNEKSEKQSITDLIEISNSLIRNCFDYTIRNGEPTNIDGKWSVPLAININKNKNWDNFVNFFYSTLKQVGMGVNDIEKYTKLNLPLFSVGLFDNRNLTYSTPTILFKSRYDKLDFLKAIQKKEYMFSYYYLKNIVNSGTQIGFLTNDIKEAMSVQSKYLSLDEYAMNRSELGTYFFTSNPSGIFNMIVLRKRESFDLLMNFITHLHQNIRNVEIDNGISKLNLQIPSYYSSKTEDYSTLGDVSCFPISFLTTHRNFFFTGTAVDIWNYSNELREVSLGVNLETWMDRKKWNVRPMILRNRSWEQKIIEQRKVAGGYTCGLFSDSLVISPYDERYFDAGRNYSKSYFDYVFGNFAIYNFEIQQLMNNYKGGNGYSMILHFPLQLSLIGNDEGVVFSFRVNNILNTDQISKVGKYTVDKSAR